LPPFTTIQACLPFNFAVAPSPPANYAVTTVGEVDVLDAISYVVADGTLVLSTDANFDTTGGIKLTVGPLVSEPQPDTRCSPLLWAPCSHAASLSRLVRTVVRDVLSLDMQ
jgi:hypothetical protein